jgi:tetratricopeptide (TPR) repeat protein
MIACGSSDSAREEEVMALVPSVPPELVHHLIASDDSTLYRHIRQHGIRYLLDAGGMIHNDFCYQTQEDYARCAEILFPLMDRIREAVQNEYNLSIDPVGHLQLKAMTPEEGVRFRRLLAERGSITSDPDANIAKIESLKELAREFESMGLLGPVMNCYGEIAGLYSQLGDQPKRQRYLYLALAQAEECKNPPMISQFSGSIGGYYRVRGQIDSMKFYYDKALEIGHRYRLPTKTARIYSFYAGYYYDEGRISLANRLRQLAIDTCREYKSGYREHRFVNESMEMHADLEAWEIVARLLPRARALAGSHHVSWQSVGEWYTMNTDCVEARYLMATGQVDAANAIFKNLAPRFKLVGRPSYYAAVLLFWSEGLLNNGHAADATAMIEEALETAESGRHGAFPKLILLASRAALETGDTTAAIHHLERFDEVASSWSEELRREWNQRDILSIRLQLARGDIARAQSAVDEALGRLTTFVEGTDGGSEGYLWLSGGGELKTVLLEMTGDDPLTSLGAERYRRELLRQLGIAARARGGPADVTAAFDLFRQFGERAVSFARERNTIYLTYVIHADQVWRWTCDARGVRSDVLDISTRDLAALSKDAWQTMATDPLSVEAPPPSNLIAISRKMAKVLLPRDVIKNRASHTSVYVTADGFLRQIPFETFNVSDGNDYDPLLRHCDVVYVRHLDKSAKTQATNTQSDGLVVVSTARSSRFGNSYSNQRNLEQARKEGQFVAAKFPKCVFLQGKSATKSNITQLWEDVSFIYVASHIASDPDAPYLSLLPLASIEQQAAQGGPDAAFLDVADVRSADLSRCEVVVLSGCSSGTPYVGRRNTAPSFGDAFLDAGAGAVVQTYWDVRDDRARDLMEAFVSRWDGSSASVVKALCDARREAMQGPDGIRHPFSWAAYSVQINGR